MKAHLPLLATDHPFPWHSAQIILWVNKDEMGFPGGSVAKILPAMQELQEMWVQSLGPEDPLEEEETPEIFFCWWEGGCL